jgi:hypothetical protein
MCPMRRVGVGQVLTHSQEEIERVMGGIMMEQLLSITDINEVDFDQFRTILGNCVKIVVTLDGIDTTVLIATKMIESGDGLFMNYSNLELYGIWTEHQNRVVVMEPPLSKIDILITNLSLELSHLLMKEDSLDNRRKEIDYRMRIDALRKL